VITKQQKHQEEALAKAKTPKLTTIELSSSYSDFQVEVEFEGNIYEAQCSIVQLTTHDKFRCRISYYDVPPITFGTYSSSTLSEMKEDAKRKFTDLLGDLSKERRIPKRNA
jgi:type 1 fimbria pilin